MERFLVKLVINAAVVMLFLYGFTDAATTQIVIASILFPIIGYIIGDQLILRTAGNAAAVIADIGLAGVFFWGMAWYYGWDLSFGELVGLSLLVGVVEWGYHTLLRRWDNRRIA